MPREQHELKPVEGASAALQMVGNRQVSVFVGQWAPTFLILGVYNKLVKQLGPDRKRRAGGLAGRSQSRPAVNG